jgi:hypothetical protein
MSIFILRLVPLEFSPIASLAAPVEARPGGRGADSADRPACTGGSR